MKKKLLFCIMLGTLLSTLVGCTTPCKVDGCKDEVYQEGYCNYHYTLEHTCKVDNCEDEVYEKGYCNYHYTVEFTKEKIDQGVKNTFDKIFGN